MRRSGVRAVRVAAVVVSTMVALLCGAAAPAVAATTRLGDDAVVDDYVGAFHPPGLAAAVLTPDGRTRFLLRGTDGRGEPVTEDTRFRIASMSKAFTSVAVMRLVDAGRVRLDQPVGELLPELDLGDPRSARMTLRHLLSHTSGLSNERYDEYALPVAGSTAEVVSDLRGVGLVAEPGTRFEYYNTNYVLAARVVERVTGQDVDTHLAEQVLAPLGMTSTTSTVRCDQQPPDLAPGHIGAFAVRVAVPELPGLCAGNGGVVSTVADMATWARFQTGDGTTASGRRLLTPESLRETHTAQPGAQGYGLGWREVPLPGTSPAVGHGGTLATFTGDITLRDAGVAAVVLTNSGGAPSELTAALVAVAEGRVPAGATNPLTAVDLVLAGLTTTVLLLGATGVWRARRWAVRRGRARWRLVVPVLPVVVGTALPFVVGASTGLTGWGAALYVTWLLPMTTVLAVALVVAGTAVLLARVSHLRWRRSDRPADA
ncbi:MULTISPECIES: serine hydrolase [unclassified Pseudonocardia]|uniref:serine hydrolase domain-containing protein n=1 Tax=unclassified Pseudonocardia TaxID=2619320 RepID=UPI001CF6CC65|nr:MULTISPECIES: serine hydrolase domain-containing protein [unclassified Pseudonocardia]